MTTFITEACAGNISCRPDAVHFPPLPSLNFLLIFPLDNCAFGILHFSTAMDICLIRNNLREGTAKISEDKIRVRLSPYFIPVLTYPAAEEMSAKFQSPDPLNHHWESDTIIMDESSSELSHFRFLFPSLEKIATTKVANVLVEQINFDLKVQLFLVYSVLNFSVFV